MAAVTLLPIASRGPFTSPPLTIPGGSPRHIQIVLTGSDFPTNSALTFDFAIRRSPDGVAPFEPYYGSGGSQGGQQGLPVGKFGAIYDGIPRLTVSWDGVGCVIQIVCTPNQTFVWGLTAEVLAV